MDIKNAKKNLNKKVVYKGINDTYKFTACTIRKGENGYYYQAELLDTKHGNSVIVCKLDDITECEK